MWMERMVFLISKRRDFACAPRYGPWLCDIATELHRLVWISDSFGIFLNDSTLLTRKGLSLQSGGHCASIFKQVEHSATKWLLNADSCRYIYEIPVWAAYQHPDVSWYFSIPTLSSRFATTSIVCWPRRRSSPNLAVDADVRAAIPQSESVHS